MPHGTVAVLATDATFDRAAVLAALAMSDTEEAHLDIHCIGRCHGPSAGAEALAADGLAADGLAAGPIAPAGRPDDRAALARAEALEAALRPVIPRHRRNIAFHPQALRDGSAGAQLASTIRFADWIVAAAPLDPQDRRLQIAGLKAGLLMGGVPVMLVPREGAETAHAPARIAVAWDGSRGALAAVRAALPLLRRAGLVDVIVVDPDIRHGDRSDPGGDLALFLARNGARVEINVLARSRPRIPEVLVRHCCDTAAEAVVMGACGHARPGRALFGTTSRGMLRLSKIPLILSR
jgi:nucleotide-binding universal stress UspA family protein